MPSGPPLVASTKSAHPRVVWCCRRRAQNDSSDDDRSTMATTITTTTTTTTMNDNSWWPAVWYPSHYAALPQLQRQWQKLQEQQQQQQLQELQQQQQQQQQQAIFDHHLAFLRAIVQENRHPHLPPQPVVVFLGRFEWRAVAMESVGSLTLIPLMDLTMWDQQLKRYPAEHPEHECFYDALQEAIALEPEFQCPGVPDRPTPPPPSSSSSGASASFTESKPMSVLPNQTQCSIHSSSAAETNTTNQKDLVQTPIMEASTASIANDKSNTGQESAGITMANPVSSVVTENNATPSLPSNFLPIHPRDSWEQVWQTLEQAGWHYCKDYTTQRIHYYDDQCPPNLWELEALHNYLFDTYQWQPQTPSIPPHHRTAGTTTRRMDNTSQGSHDEESVAATTTATAMESQQTNITRTTIVSEPQPPQPNQVHRIETVTTPLMGDGTRSSRGGNLKSTDNIIHRQNEPSPESTLYSHDSDDYCQFPALWKRLSKRGWKCKYVTTLTESLCYYYMPGVTKKTAKEGINAFQGSEAVIRYVQEQRSRKKNKKAPTSLSKTTTGKTDATTKAKHESANATVVTRHQSQRTIVSSTHQRRSVVPKKGRESSKVTITPGTDTTKQPTRGKPRVSIESSQTPAPRNSKDSEFWWKCSPETYRPTKEQLRDILNYLEITTTSDGKFILPYQQKLELPNLYSLRIFFLSLGVPKPPKPYHSPVVYANFERWIKLTNVPRVRAKKLATIKIPKSDTELYPLLMDLKFERCGGDIFRPHCPHSGRVKGVHYFPENQLWGQFRLFCRRAAHLECRPTTLHSRTPDQEESYLKIRLWAAASNETLPTLQRNFQGSSSRDMRLSVILDEIKSLNEPTDQVSTDGGSDVNSVSDEDNHGNVGGDDGGVGDDVADDCVSSDSSLQSNTDYSKVKVTDEKSKSSGKKELAWYLCAPPPLWMDVEAILQRLGWKEKGKNEWFHPKLPDMSFSQHQLRLFMCSERLPKDDQTEIDKDLGLSPVDCQTLHRWATSVHLVPFWDQLEKANLLKDTQLQILLFKLGFTTACGKFYRPGADVNRTERVGYSMPELLAFMRGSEQWNALVPNQREIGPSSYSDILSHDQMLNILFTAFRVDLPLPSFAKDPVIGGKKRRRSISVSPLRELPLSTANISRKKMSLKRTTGRNLAAMFEEHADIVSPENADTKVVPLPEEHVDTRISGDESIAHEGSGTTLTTIPNEMSADENPKSKEACEATCSWGLSSSTHIPSDSLMEVEEFECLVDDYDQEVDQFLTQPADF